MRPIPVTNYHFAIEEALRELGFTIDERSSGACVACGFVYEGYREIFVEFYQSFITRFQTDMRVFYYTPNHRQENLYLGVMPVNKRDFNMLMQYLLPSEDFYGRLGMME